MTVSRVCECRLMVCNRRIELQILAMQKQASLKFEHKKVYEYLVKEKNALTTLTAFFKTSDDYEKNSGRIIEEQQKDITQSAAKMSNKQIVKLVTNFSIHATQRQQSAVSSKLINQKAKGWVQTGCEILTQLQQKSRNLEKQAQNKALTQQQMAAFRQQLSEGMLKVQELRQLAISTYGHHMIRDACVQVEELTSKMQIELERGSKIK